MIHSKTICLRMLGEMTMAATREAGHEHIHTHGHDHTHAHDHGHDHTHDHDHVHPHDHEHAQDKWHAHTHDAAHPHTHGGVNDYMQAISAYRKTFPSRQQVLEQTPDPAVRVRHGGRLLQELQHGTLQNYAEEPARRLRRGCRPHRGAQPPAQRGGRRRTARRTCARGAPLAEICR